MRVDIKPVEWPIIEGYHIVDVIEHAKWLGEESIKLMLLPGEKYALMGNHVLFYAEDADEAT